MVQPLERRPVRSGGPSAGPQRPHRSVAGPSVRVLRLQLPDTFEQRKRRTEHGDALLRRQRGEPPDLPAAVAGHAGESPLETRQRGRVDRHRARVRGLQPRVQSARQRPEVRLRRAHTTHDADVAHAPAVLLADRGHRHCLLGRRRATSGRSHRAGCDDARRRERNSVFRVARQRLRRGFDRSGGHVMTGLWIIIAVVVLLALALVASYNRFVRQRNLVQESWRQVDVELNRRHDLIPNLVETVKGYATQERTVLQSVTEARTAAVQTLQAQSAGVTQQAQAENNLGRALNGLFAVAENYPDLKSSQNFLALQQQLAETEDRIAAARRFYNGNVRALNTRVEAFPSSIIASTFNFAKADYFEVDDPAVRAPVAVDFSLAPTTPSPTSPPQTGQSPS